MDCVILAALALMLTSPVAADTTLTNGQPVQGFAPKDGQAWYTFGIPKGNNYPIRVTVTATAGDPDLFLSCTPHPTSRTAVWKATEYGNDTISISPASLSARNCGSTLFMTVVGAGAILGQSADVHFTIVAVYGSGEFAVTVTEAASGTVVGDGVNPGYAQYKTTAAATSVTLSMEVRTGSGAEMYVSQNSPGATLVWPVMDCTRWSGSTGLCVEAEPRKSSYTAGTTDNGQSPGSVTLTGNFAVGTVFLAAVVSSDAGQVEADVSVANGADATELSAGVSSYFRVDTPGAYEQMFFNLFATPDSPRPEVTVNLHPIWGRCGMFMSEAANPTNASHTWGTRSNGNGDAELNVPFASLSATCQAAILANSSCKLYVAAQNLEVEGSMFSVYWAVGGSAAEPIMLPTGSSVAFDLSAGAYGYFLAQPSSPLGQPSYTVSVGGLSGYGNMFLNLGTFRNFYPFDKPADDSPPYEGGQAVARIDTSNPYYCINCPVKVTIQAGTFGFAGSVTLTMDNVTEVVPLTAGEPMPGSVGDGAYTYYSFTVHLDPPVPIRFDCQALSGDPDLFVSVRDPSRPNALPSQGSYTWKSDSWGTDTLEIGANSAGYTSDGTYLIAVQGATADGSISEYSLTATASEANVVRDLPEEQYVPASMSANGYAFFIYQPCSGATDDDTHSKGECPGGVVPAVKFEWAVEMGDVDVFITDRWHRNSPSSLLPVAGNPSLPNMWSITNRSRWAFIGPGVPHYNPGATAYTIGIKATSNFGASVSIRGRIMPSGSSVTVTKLAIGVPSGPYQVSRGVNSYFAFDYGDLSLQSDIFVGVSAEQGQVDLVIAPPDRETGRAQAWPPRCGATHFVPPMPCFGYVYKSYWSDGAAVGINHYSPCHPFDGPQPNSNCSAATFREGTWLATVYAEDDATFTITAQTSNAHVPLSENSEARLSTEQTLICAGRNGASGTCKPGFGTSTAYAAWMQASLRVASPGSGAAEDAQIQISRDCSGRLGGCGPPLHLYAASCATPGIHSPPGAVACGGNYGFPSEEFHQLKATITGSSGALYIPGNTQCGPTLSWTPFRADDDDFFAAVGLGQSRRSLRGEGGEVGDDFSLVETCTWYIGAFSGRTATSPGQADEFSATLSVSNDDSIDVIGESSTTPGTTYVAPIERLSSDSPVKFYDVYFNRTTSPSVRVTALACQGSPTIYACEPGSGCSDQYHPGPGAGKSTQVGTYDPTAFAASLVLQSLPGGELNLGVASTTPGSFQMEVSVGSGPILYGPRISYTALSSVGTLVTQWGQTHVYRQGQMMKAVAGVKPTYYVFDKATLPAQAVLGTSCGISEAYNAHLGPGAYESGEDRAVVGDDGFLSLPFRLRLGTGSSEYRLTGLDPSKSLLVTVEVACDSSCMPNGEPAMVGASPPKAPGAGPATSPTPAPIPGASATPTPGSNPSGGMGGGAIAGIVIGSLAGVGVAGAGCLWFVRNRGGGGGDDMMGYYTSAD